MAQSDSGTAPDASVRITLFIFVSNKRPQCAKMATILDEFHMNPAVLKQEENKPMRCVRGQNYTLTNEK